jgi:hypothetical protein
MARKSTKWQQASAIVATESAEAHSTLYWNTRRDMFADRMPLMWKHMRITASCMDGYDAAERERARHGLLGEVGLSYALGAIDCNMRHLLVQMIEAARVLDNCDRLYEMLRQCETAGCCTVHQFVASAGVNEAIVENFSKEKVLQFLATPKKKV